MTAADAARIAAWERFRDAFAQRRASLPPSLARHQALRILRCLWAVYERAGVVIA